jgi:phthiocerol/phenolphthiocerol synthesis type-I polyketide synthase E
MIEEDGAGRVAIVGLACRFPGARNAGEFWTNLENGVEAVRVFEDEELIAAGADPELVRSPNYVKAAPVLDDVELFDPAMFGMTRREAELMDPQGRLFLEVAFHALEDAGCDPTRYPGDIAVYGGLGVGLYGWLHLRFNPAVRDGPLTVGVANNPDYLTTQVSYRLNLRGPSVALQAACSTSLVAVHMACESLRSGECDMALAGGVSIELPQISGYQHFEGGIESADGHCRAFDAGASGTVWGSGAGVVALKLLPQALADGDRVYAVILGTAVNNDGASKLGFSAPSVQGQAEVVAQALAVAGVDPSTVTYVEAHGTGTPLGDPIEVAALTEVYRRATPAVGCCALGSVKTNIGHLAQAAGVAGLIKAALCVRHGRLVPSLNFERPNPKMDLEHSPFYVSRALSVWEPPAGVPRRAGVSSFGIGGTNAHAVLEEAPPVEPSGPSRPWQVLTVSARKAALLDAATVALANHLRSRPDLPLADAAFTAQLGRTARPLRRALVCRDAADAATGLVSGKRAITGAEPARARQPVFLFPGQGAQYAGMTRELYELEPVYRDVVDRCADLLRPHLGLDVRDVLFAASPDGPEIAPTSEVQPALFVVEYALARLWMSWGVVPRAMIGHSIGEYVAACLAGVFELEDALALVAARGRLMQSLPAGAMLAVQMPAEALEPLLPDGVGIAALNGPSLTVVSGPEDAVVELQARLPDGTGATRLKTSHAFHSAMMDPVLERFAALVANARREAPEIPIVSNLTGTWLTAAEARDPEYWARHLRQPVRFADGVRELLTEPDRVYVEVGPGRTLSGLFRMRAGKSVHAVTSVRQARQSGSDQEVLLRALAELWTLGVDVDWKRFWAGECRRRVELPPSPLDRQRCWIERPASRVRPDETVPAPSGRLPIERWFWLPAWTDSPSASAPAPAPESVLVLADEHGLGHELAEAVRAAGGRAVEVPVAGPELDYDRLVAELLEAGPFPPVVVHAGTVAPAPPCIALEPAELERGRRLGFFSLLHLAQALAARQVTSPVRLVVLTSDAQSVPGGRSLRPASALVAGPCRVLPSELTNLSCVQVDVGLPAAGSRQRDRLVAQLMAELGGTGASEVALRDGRRWTREHRPVELPPAADADGLRERGVYLITGGTGGIGLTLARDLARRRRARLVLTARRPRPEVVAELEAAGAEVLLVSADAASAADMAEVRRQLLERFGELHGIVHAAGIAGGGLAEVKTDEQAAAVLAPKVEGAANLAELFADLDLDFVSLCSSITAVAGGLGQVDYCAANAFMDALAQSDAFGDAEVCSVNWTGWLEAGMAVETAAPAAFRELQAGARWDDVDHPILTRVQRLSDGRATFSGVISTETHWVLDEHRLAGVPVLPGTTYLELARAAFVHLEGEGPVELREVEFIQPLAVPEGERRELRLVLEAGEFRALSAPPGGGEWLEHARGRVRRAASAPGDAIAIDAIAARCTPVAADAADERPGLLSLGAHWTSLCSVAVREGEALSVFEAPAAVAMELPSLPLHPALLDEAAASGLAAASSQLLPVGYGRLVVHRPLTARLACHMRQREPGSPGSVVCDLVLADEAGVPLVEIEEFALRRVDELSVGAALEGAGAAVAVVEGDGIRLAEGADAFRRLVAWHPARQVVVSTTDLPALLAGTRELTQEALETELSGVQLVASDGERTLETAYVAPRTEIERVVAGIWTDALGVPNVGVDDDFFELGGNSLVAVQLLSRITTSLGVRLAMRRLFDAPTVAGLAQAVQSQM